jgi:hypothetical protein
VIQRKVIKAGDFEDGDALTAQLLAAWAAILG